MNLISSVTARRILLCVTALITPHYIAAQESANRTDQTSAAAPTDEAITLTVTVTDGRVGYVSGLTSKDFTVLDDKSPQEITFFAQNDVPMNVGILLDLSGSMKAPDERIIDERFDHIREGLARFIENGNKADEYFLAGFTKNLEVLSDYTRNVSPLLDKIHSLEVKGETALYDSIRWGVEKVLRGPNPKRVILLISDGFDNVSKENLKKLKRLLKETDALIYAFDVSGIKRSRLHTHFWFDREGRRILKEIVEISGGVLFFPQKMEQIKDVFETIAVELHHQYTLRFQPSKPGKAGKWHSIKIKAMPPKNTSQVKRLYVRHRKGYYAGTGLR